jgi:hypothetical protein
LNKSREAASSCAGINSRCYLLETNALSATFS